MEEINPKQLSPLQLAYIGDAVYELYVRNRLIKEHPDMPPHKLHIASSKRVSAKAQSNSMLSLEEKLSEEELTIYKRGRNAKSATVPKNADVRDYRHATGFEALIGYVYFTKNEDRLQELMEIAYINSLNTNKD